MGLSSLSRFIQERQRPLCMATVVTLVSFALGLGGLSSYRQKQIWDQTREAAHHLREYLEQPVQQLSLLALTLRLSLDQLHREAINGEEPHRLLRELQQIQQAIARQQPTSRGLLLGLVTRQRLISSDGTSRPTPPALLSRLSAPHPAAVRRPLLADVPLGPDGADYALYAEPLAGGTWAIAALPQADLLQHFAHSATEELSSYDYRIESRGNPERIRLLSAPFASEAQPASLTLPILSPGGPWHLQVAPRARRVWEPAQLGPTALAMVLGFFTYRLLRLPSKLSQTLELQTAELLMVQKALEDSRNGVVITDYQPEDPDNRYPIRYVNRAFTTITGYSREEVLGRDSRLLQDPESDPEARNRIRLALREGRSCREVLHNRRKSGELFWNELTISPVFNDRGSIIAFLGFQQDVTERVEATARLEEQNAALEEARRQAEAADEAKGRFLATMSHELRTPLNAVIGMAHLLQGTRLDPQQQAKLQTIQSSSELLLSLISDILDFSKIESGNLDLSPELIDPVTLVDEITDILAPLASSKGLDLYAPIDPHLPARLAVDSLRLRQVLLNLIGNAIKFTDVGHISMSLEQQVDSDGRRWLAGRVRDTGIGISSQQQSRLFEPFAQGDSTTTRRFGGTGLGLVISRRLCQLMGGDLTLEQSSLQGSSFLWRIRVDSDDPSPPPPVAQPQTIRVLCHRQEPAAHLCSRLERMGHQLSASHRCAPPLPDEWLFLGPRLLRQDPELITLARSFGDRLVLLGDIPCPVLPQARRLALPTRITQLEALLTPTGESPAAVGPVPDSEEPPESRLRILLAEDNPINQRVALALLERWGYHADVVPSGREILDQLPQLPYDLVLMDLQMPDVDGYAATRAIRDRNSSQPWIVAMTANALESDRQQCLDAGMNDYISKPIRPQRLQEVIEQAARALSRSRIS